MRSLWGACQPECAGDGGDSGAGRLRDDGRWRAAGGFGRRNSGVETHARSLTFPSVTTDATTLEATDRLTMEEQKELAATLRRSSAEKRRAELIAGVLESRRAFALGRCKPANLAAIMRRVRS